jgi:hypothetical protein
MDCRRISRNDERLTQLKAGIVHSFFFQNGSKMTKKSIIESGTEAALLLGDKKRQDIFKKDVNKQFPMIPPAVLDVCMDALSASFQNVAPVDLKKALKPGGMDKVRSRIEATVVQTLKKQQVINNIPLSNQDKTELLEYIVGLSMDHLLKDVEVALMAPALKLQTLEREQYEVRKYMTRRQLIWYRLRYFPASSIGFALLIVWTSYLTYHQFKDTFLLSSITSAITQICAGVGCFLVQVSGLLAKVSTGNKPSTAKRWR